MGEAVSSVLTRYATFSGRPRRSEYWWFALAYFFADLVASVADTAFDTSLFGVVLLIALLLPTLAVGARRLHDVGRSGWWLLIGLVPLVGAIVMRVLARQDSELGTNRWGPSPRYGF